MTAADELLLDTPATRPCVHGGRHQHGDLQRYNQDRCRCLDCRKANAAYRRERREQTRTGYGRWSAFVDAAPVRAHVQNVMQETGAGWRAIAARAQLTPDTVRRLLYGLNGGAPSRRLQRKTADALYAIPAGRDRPPPRPGLWGRDP